MCSDPNRFIDIMSAVAASSRSSKSSLSGLHRSRKWAEFVYLHALAHGWEAFIVETTFQGKTTFTEMPASEERNGSHIYRGSYNKRLETGIVISMKDAMSLALYYKRIHPEMYQLWESQL